MAGRRRAVEGVGVTGPRPVTGGYGLLGSWLVRALLERGEEVVLLRRDEPARSALELWGLEPSAAPSCAATSPTRRSSIARSASTRSTPSSTSRRRPSWAPPTARRWAPGRPTCAAPGCCSRPAGATRWRAGGRRRIGQGLRAERRAALPREPSAGAERPLRHEQGGRRPDRALLLPRPTALPVATTRFANLYGGGDFNRSRLIPEAVTAALAGRAPVIRSDGSPQRDFLYVEDAVAAYLAIARRCSRRAAARAGEALNAGSGAAALRARRRAAGVRGGRLRRRAGHPRRGHAGRARSTASTSTRPSCARLTGWTPQVVARGGPARAPSTGTAAPGYGLVTAAHCDACRPSRGGSCRCT